MINRREELKEKIEKIGQINPLAMEAYKEIKERHEFITKEREDLLEAKDSLLKTIEEIDIVAKESFLKSFEKIKSNFKTVFRSLFTDDDDCDLLINDEENPLESSIEIMAKPKGKKPLTINQLSGGEKTLTATSLLFAIYLLKPAPFCVFDEVDAPLDDANIDKFNKSKNLLMGFTFGFGFTPCIGPVLGALLTLSSKAETINSGIFYLIMFSLGMGIPFLSIAILSNRINLKNRLFVNFQKFSSKFSGLVLIGIGFLIYTDKTYILAAFFQEILYLLNLDWLSTI